MSISSGSSLSARLLVGVSLLCLTARIGSAHAQSADPALPGTGASTPHEGPTASATPNPAPAGTTTEGEIVVTGFRASIAAAATLKRRSNVIQESITSEDLGKFPDSNVAEALQRIPGVSIDRVGGEGRFITVRGFGPEFETVLINGRSIASDQPGRAFSFDVIAAELISGADVLKSSRAGIQEGGIGATVNLHTPRPLELPRFKAVASIKGNYETNSGSVTPQAFGLISVHSADDRWGGLISFVYQKRKRESDTIEVGGYGGRDLGTPAFQTNVRAPGTFIYGTRADDRERIGGNATFQFQPSPSLTFTLDGLYSQLKTDETYRNFSIYPGYESATEATVNSDNVLSSVVLRGITPLLTYESFIRTTETKQVGFNADWKPTSTLRLSYDASYSTVNFGPSGTNYSYHNIERPNSDFSFTQPRDGSAPYFSALNFDPTASNSYIIGQSYYAGETQTEPLFETKGDVAWTPASSLLKSIHVGALYNSRTRNYSKRETNIPNYALFNGSALSLPSGLLRPVTLGQSYLAGAASGRIPNGFVTYDQDALVRATFNSANFALVDARQGLAPGTTEAAFIARGGLAPGSDTQQTYSVNERTFAAYIETEFGGNLGSLPWVVSGGVRFINTDSKATGIRPELLDILASTNTNVQPVYSNGGAQLRASSSSYREILPSGNVRLELPYNVVARFAGSQTLTRPALRDLAPRQDFYIYTPDSLSATGGNVNLKPYKATNFDLSLEWYPSKTAFFSLGLFYKDIKNFIVTQRALERFPITNSQRLDLAVPPAGVVRPPEVNRAFPVFGPNYVDIPTTRQRNGEKANVKGIEIAGTYGFDFLPAPFDGLGLTANATFVFTDANYDRARPPSEIFTLQGLGNSQNATLFYERGPLEARIAYNRREGYLTNPTATGDEPAFRKTYGQVDFRASYDVRKGVNLFVEGINVTSALQGSEGRLAYQVLRIEAEGARYLFGLRADF